MQKRKGIKILSVSFWVIALAHILAFTAIGLFTNSGWRLLIIFLFGLVVMVFAKRGLMKIIRRRNRVRREFSANAEDPCTT